MAHRIQHAPEAVATHAQVGQLGWWMPAEVTKTSTPLSPFLPKKDSCRSRNLLAQRARLCVKTSFNPLQSQHAEACMNALTPLRKTDGSRQPRSRHHPLQTRRVHRASQRPEQPFQDCPPACRWQTLRLRACRARDKQLRRSLTSRRSRYIAVVGRASAALSAAAVAVQTLAVLAEEHQGSLRKAGG